ncbi:MAG: hypothetical protein HY827_08975 [Actinobacteria bacterium]|nr:hypothetical protein [Actinomycetota bacterium]
MSQRSKSRKQQIEVGPEICPRCYSDLVQPVEARAQNNGSVRLRLRCPECEHVSIDEYSWDDARSLGRTFSAGRSLLRAAHDELAKENFLDELDCFVLALAADLIGPDDFAPYRYAA